MAIARIEVFSKLDARQRQEHLNAVHAALVSALMVPDNDPTVSITELDPDDVLRPGGVTSQFTIVQVTLFVGRSIEAKRALYQAICSSLVALGVPPNDILIVLVETPIENWGVQGGTPATEVNLDFQVDI